MIKILITFTVSLKMTSTVKIPSHKSRENILIMERVKTPKFLEPIANGKFPKYKIAELLRNKYGELNYKQGLDDLVSFCQLRKKQTVADWLTIPAGSEKRINHLVMPFVLGFFDLKNEKQLLTKQHKHFAKEAA